jgi:hypothetical protein
MLVSRAGSLPGRKATSYYLFEDTAGGDGGKAFHPGCDCLVVPVFDRNDWPGKEAADEAIKKWVDALPDEVDPDKLYRVRQKDGTYKLMKLKAGEAKAREALMKIRRDFATP